MSDRSDCPERELFVGFLNGSLEDVQVESIEAHLAKCDACGDTVRSLNVNDTFTDLVRDANEKSSAAPPSEIDGLLVQLEALADPETSASADGLDASDDLPSRVLEVQLLLNPAKGEGEIRRLAHYRILRLLGAGGMGVVYQAEDIQLKRLVALKILRPSLGVSARDRFVLEAQVAAAIDHDNVITIYHVGREGPLAFLAMQWLEGETLEDRLRRQDRLNSDQASQIGSQVAEGLAAAHAKKLIHRDIKPANIWLEAGRNRAKILDFGLAQIVDDDPQLTETGMIAGTPAYMSPEQAQGRSVDERSDLFSLGTMLYRMLTGTLPFDSKNALATIRSIQLDAPESPRQFDMTIPSTLSDTVMDLLEKEPRNRPESATDVARCLVEKKRPHGSKPRVRPQLMPTQSRSGWWRAGIVAAVLLSCGGYFAGPTIYRIVTDSAEITVKSEDPNVKVEVLQGGTVIRVIDTSTKDSVTLRSGSYELKLKGEQSNLSIEPNKITLHRNDVETASVTRRSIGIANQDRSNTSEKLREMKSALDRMENIAATEAEEPTEYQILDEIEKEPRYFALITKIDEYKDDLARETQKAPNSAFADQAKAEIDRLMEAREDLFQELRPRIIARLKARGTAISPTVAPPSTKLPPEELKILVVKAKHERAAELERKLGQLLPERNGLRVVSNGASNSLVLTGSKKSLDLAVKLLQELDVESLPAKHEATYEGKSFAEWMSVLKLEKSNTELSKAILAVTSLATSETSAEICAAFVPIIRQHGSRMTAGRGRSSVSTRINSGLQKLDQRIVAEFVRDEMKFGTAKSRAFLQTLLWDRGTKSARGMPGDNRVNEQREFWAALTPLANELSEYLVESATLEETRDWAVQCLCITIRSLPNVLNDVSNTDQILDLLEQQLQSNDKKTEALLLAETIASIDLKSNVLVDYWLPNAFQVGSSPSTFTRQAKLAAKMGSRSASAIPNLLKLIAETVRLVESRAGEKTTTVCHAGPEAIVLIATLGEISSMANEEAVTLLQEYAAEDLVDINRMNIKKAATDALRAIKARETADQVK